MSQTLDKQLHAIIDNLNNQQKKAVLGIVKALVDNDDAKYDHWEDEEFVAEMDRRYKEYKAGNTKLVSLDQVEKKARAAALKLNSKKAS
jgi:putative addiction module component (TIGR02574 family)